MRQAAVQDSHRLREDVLQMKQRVAVLGEDDSGLASAAQEPDENRYFRFVPGGCAGGGGERP